MFTKKRIFAFGVIVGLCGAALYTGDRYVRARISDGVDTWFAALRGQGFTHTAYGGLDVNLLGRSATIYDLQIGRDTKNTRKRSDSNPAVRHNLPPLTFSAASLTISGLETSSRGFALEAISLSDARLTSDDMQLHAASFSADDVSFFPSPNPVADNQTLSPAVTRALHDLLQLNAAQVQLAGLSQRLPVNAQMQIVLTLDDLAFDAMAHGRIEAGRFNGLRLAQAAPMRPSDEDKASVSSASGRAYIARGGFHDLDLSVLAEFLQQVPSLEQEAPAAWHAVLKTFTLQTVRLNPPDERSGDTIELASLVACPCRMRPHLNDIQKKQLHRAFSGNFIETDDSFAAILLPIIAASSTVDGLQLEDVAVGTHAQDQGGNAAHLSVDTLKLTDLSGKHIETMALSGVRVSTGETQARLGGIAVSGIDLTALSARQPKTQTVSQTSDAPPSGFAGFALDTIIGTRPQRLQLGALEISTAGDTSLRIETLDISANDYADHFPQKAHIVASAVSIPTAALPDGPLRSALAQMDYEPLKLSLAGELLWFPRRPLLRLQDIKMTMDDAGELVLDADLHGFVPRIEVFSSFSETGLASASLGDLSLHFTNNTLVEKLFDWVTLSTRLPANAQQVLLDDQVRIFTDRLGDPHLQDTARRVARTFAEKPQNLSLHLRPATPVPLLQLALSYRMLPSGLPPLLNIDLRVNEKTARAVSTD